jgi:hypothetical protein
MAGHLKSVSGASQLCIRHRLKVKTWIRLRRLQELAPIFLYRKQTTQAKTKAYVSWPVLGIFLNLPDPQGIFPEHLNKALTTVLQIQDNSPADPGSGSGMNFFRIPDPAPFFDDIFLQYLQNPCYVIFITLAYS